MRGRYCMPNEHEKDWQMDMRRRMTVGSMVCFLLAGMWISVLAAECAVHRFGDWVNMGDYRERVCTVCGATESADIPAHTCSDTGVWRYDEKRHFHVCAVCGSTMDEASHLFDDGQVVREPTVQTEGTMEYSCTVCGYVQTARIPCLPESEEPEVPADTMTDSVETEAPAETEAPVEPTVPVSPPPSKDTEGGEASWENPFIDINEKHPFYDAVRFVYEHALFVGIETDEGLTFAPGDPMTRAMFVTVLGRLADIRIAEYGNEDSPFSDVDTDAWYAPYVAWAEKTGIVRGYDTGCFGVDDLITIEQAAVIIARFAKAEGLTVFDASHKNVLYPDAAAISDWAAADVGWCLYTGIYVPDQKIEPRRNTSRARAADMLMRYTEKFSDVTS